MSTPPPPPPALPRRSAEEQARLDLALIDIFEQRITFNHTVGLKVVSLALGQPLMRLDMRKDLAGHYLYGRLHGGVIATALDAMGALSLMVAMGDKHQEETAEQVQHRFARLGTIDLRVDYLRQGTGPFFMVSAEVTRLGGRVGSTQMRLTNQEGELVATGAGAYMVS
jgi:uncharacterized protein (TIGR00369 family)